LRKSGEGEEVTRPKLLKKKLREEMKWIVK
jgi:hypothetical protein